MRRFALRHDASGHYFCFRRCFISDVENSACLWHDSVIVLLLDAEYRRHKIPYYRNRALTHRDGTQRVECKTHPCGATLNLSAVQVQCVVRYLQPNPRTVYGGCSLSSELCSGTPIVEMCVERYSLSSEAYGVASRYPHRRV